MIPRTDLTALPAEKKAELIYSRARAEMTNQLWRAAIGGADNESRPSASQPAMAGGIDGFLAALGIGAPFSERARIGSTADADHGPAQSGSSGENLLAGDIGAITALGPNQRYQGDLTSAAARTGVPAPTIAAIINAESAKAPDGSWQVYSRNTRSSAAGIGQFLSGTWQGMAEMKGSWLNDLARARGWLSGSGRVIPEARSALLALRYDASAAINTLADYARHNLDGLRQRGVAIGTGLEAVTRTAYAGHYLGLGDAARFLKSELTPARARMLLEAQIGSAKSDARVAAAGDAATAHRTWFLDRVRHALHPDRFAAVGREASAAKGAAGA
jgi:hypothetical protein